MTFPARFIPPTDEIPVPPAGLGEPGVDFWQRVLTDFNVESHLMAVLELACRQLDAAAAARARKLEATSESARERAESSERSASQMFLRLRRELNLDQSVTQTKKGPPLPGERY